MAVKIALAGNPNCGKTTLFNALTGSNQFVGNWPGVTVEKKEGQLKGHRDITVVDLPGIYSLSPYTTEEIVARNYLLTERPDAIINIIDGTNMERNLYLSTQLMELGIPVVAAVNMLDIMEKSGVSVEIEKLSQALGCKVVQISALKGTGIRKAAEIAISLAQNEKEADAVPAFCEDVESAIQLVGQKLTDIPAVQKRFFSIKLLEGDEKISSQLSSIPDISEQIKELEKEFDDDVESIIINERYAFISRVVQTCCLKSRKAKLTASDNIDRIVTNRWLALPIFAVVMFFVYYVSVSTVGDFVTSWTNDTLFGSWVIPGITDTLEAIGCAGWLTGLIADGIVGGVGAVLGFVPQMFVLFACLAFLEACGYMARIAFIMDRIFRRFGLSGKSFIPMLIASGCGVPGVMASRTIESESDRRMTIMTTTFVPCGAKLPIIALIAGAFFDNAGWVSWSAYFVGIAAIICSGIILKKTKMFDAQPAPFVMELPPYHMPSAGNILRSMWERGFSFIKKAGTIILLSTIVLWFLQSFGWTKQGFTMLEAQQLDHSILAALGGVLAPIFAPLGWGDWKMAVAAVTGLIAKENVVATFGILFGFAQVAEDGAQIWQTLSLTMSGAAAYSFLVFNLLCAPCFAAMGAIKREMNDAKWFWFAIGYQCGLAYLVSMCIYQLGTLAVSGQFSVWTVVSVGCLTAFCYLLIFHKKRAGQLRSEIRPV